MKTSISMLFLAITIVKYVVAKGNNLRDDQAEDKHAFEKFFSASFAIFFAGLGDKSFLITAFMSMKYNKLLVFLSGFSALTIMGLISIQFGKILPNYINEVYINIFGGVLFIIMGVYFIFIGPDSNNQDNEEMQEIEDLVCGKQEITISNDTSNNSDREYKKNINAFTQSFSLIFFSELGDKSQIAAIWIASSSSVLLSFSVITLANGVLTILAIFAGELVEKKMSKKTLSMISGVLFVLFGLLFLQAALFGDGTEESIITSSNKSHSTLLKRKP